MVNLLEAWVLVVYPEAALLAQRVASAGSCAWYFTFSQSPPSNCEGAGTIHSLVYS